MAAPRRAVDWTEAAPSDLGDAVGFVAKRSSSAAQRLAVRAVSAARSLETLSERGRLVPDLKSSVFREVFVDRFRLVYQVSTDQVTVVAFVHGARDFARWWREAGR